MRIEIYVVGAILVAALVPLLVRSLRSRSPLGAGLALILIACGITLIGLTEASPTRHREAVPSTGRPVEQPVDDYVSSDTCRSCHPDEYSSWHGSYHRSMTQLATPEAVTGRFDGEPISYYGWSFRLDRVGDEFWATIGSAPPPGSAGPGDLATSRQIRRRIVLTTGSHHVQKYWYSTGQGRELSLLPIVYLIESGRWVPEHTAFLRPPERGMPKRDGKWNQGCNQCHATGSRPRLDRPGGPDTRVAELGIACEACHDEGAGHIAIHRDPIHRYASHFSEEPDETIANPARMSARRASQVCAQCHGVYTRKSEAVAAWSERGDLYRPGDDIFATRHFPAGPGDLGDLAAVHAETSYWGDGRVRVTGREFNALIISPCYTDAKTDEETMSCLSCHALHRDASDSRSPRTWADDQLAPGMRGNEACLQCHQDYRDRIAEHSHHPAGSSGSECLNCHMPYTSYGLLKGIRTHTIDSPSVDESLRLGRPNACNQCHLDRTLDWTAKHLASWYGQPRAALPPEHRQVSAAVLWALRGDACQRALMAWSFGWPEAQEASGTDWMVLYLAQLLFDDYDAIRYIAERSLRSIPGFSGLEYDHMRPEAAGDALFETIQRIWLSVPRKTGPETLYGPGGEFRFDLMQGFQTQRDDRPIIITE